MHFEMSGKCRPFCLGLIVLDSVSIDVRDVMMRCDVCDDNGIILCRYEAVVTGRIPSLRPVTRSFGVFFYLRPNKPVEQIIETPVVWDAIPLIITSL